ncbi:MAG TPA: DUF481 domain-containing protein [Polyangia bacterium]|nr:DUF481 domain-containing protein [Polyangia bacterium]
MKRRPLLLTAGSLLIALPALAQNSPTFTFAKPDAPKPVDSAKPAPPPPPPAVEWKAMVKGGFTMTSGNSQTTGLVGTGSVSRKEGNNRLAFDANGAYGRSNIIESEFDDPTNPTAITGFHRQDIETTNNWLLKGRYDRFFTPNNSGYAAADAAADKIAGKSFYGGGQVGYSRQVYKSPKHLVVAELGYDYSYESYVTAGTTTPPSVSIHSARLFGGETLTLTKATGITASVEAFFNLNKESNALDASTGLPGVDAFHDTRVNAKIGLTTTLFAKLSIGFGFTLKYDQNPAPLPIPPGSPAGATFDTTPGFAFQPFADKVDTLTEATLIYTFL